MGSSRRLYQICVVRVILGHCRPQVERCPTHLPTVCNIAKICDECWTCSGVSHALHTAPLPATSCTGGTPTDLENVAIYSSGLVPLPSLLIRTPPSNIACDASSRSGRGAGLSWLAGLGRGGMQFPTPCPRARPLLALRFSGPPRMTNIVLKSSSRIHKRKKNMQRHPFRSKLVGVWLSA